MRRTHLTAVAWFWGIALASAASAQTWSSPQLLNEPSEAGLDVKTARIIASKNGGFHSMYHVSNKIRYRRYNGTLLAPVNVFPGTNFMANGRLGESLNGDIHVVFEDWAGDAPEIRWYKSSDGGVSFPYTQLLSASLGKAKHPHIVPFGMGTSSEMLMSYVRSNTKQLFYARYNGTSWTAEAGINSYGYSGEYDCFGMGRSPLDGSVYRAFDPSGSSMKMRQYNGSWQPEILVYSGGWPVRQQLAVNDAGQVMILWDQDNKYYSVLYTPGSGVGPVTMVTDQASWGTSLCSIPGTNNFYTAYPNNNNGRLYGRKWAGNTWLAEELISSGMASAFTVGPHVSADPNGSGTIYVAWEYWGNGKPQQYYAIRQGLPPGPRGTVAGVVRDQYSVGVSGAVITIPSTDTTASTAGGAYSISLPVGTYSITCGKNYYTDHTVAPVVVTENQTTTVNFSINAIAPAAVSMFSVSGYDLKNRLNWTGPGTGNHTGTRICFSTSSYPTSPTSGTVLADIPSSQSSYDHTGLTNGVTYYYTLFAYFDDASRTYSTGTSASGMATTAPKPNLLINGGMDTFTSGVANGWSSYKINDPNNVISFAADSNTNNYVTSPSQGINGIDSTSLPTTGVSGAGIRQVISGLTPGKVYHYTTRQDIFTSDYGADGQRYCTHFGMNTSGGTDLGALAFDGVIDSARWMTPAQVLFNNSAGGPPKFGGFHKSWAAFPATSTSISVWSGITINNTGSRDNVTAKFNTDHAFLFEWDTTPNSSFQNGNFEGARIDLQNFDSGYAANDIVPSGWMPAGGATGTWCDIRCEPEGLRTGSYGVRIANRRGTINGGIMQRIACTQGTYQTFSAYVYLFNPENATASVGIDPTGGVDIGSGNIYWTSMTSPSNTWTQISVSATAQAPAITVFVRSLSTNAGGTGGYHAVYVDDCTYQQTGVPQPGAISGTVTDACGALIANATVATNPGNFTATTAANGTYTISNVEPGTYTVTASKTGYTAATQTGVVVITGQTTTTNLTFPSNEGTGLSGYVYSCSNTPIAGAQVNTNNGYMATTAGDGSYTILNVPAGTYTVTASASNYAPLSRANIAVSGCGMTHLDFTLSAPTIMEKIVNGSMTAPYGSFWGGSLPQPVCGQGSSPCWGATWRGSFVAAHWGQNYMSGHGDVVEMSGISTGFEAGIISQVSGLTPGATYTFSAQAYQFDQGTNVWIATDPNGGTTLPDRTTNFNNVTGQWNSQSVTGTVGSGGTVSVFVWAYHQWGGSVSVYIDNASLLVTTAPPSKPSISVWPTSLTSAIRKGTNAASQSFVISNSQTGTLNYTLSESLSWLSLTPTSGSSTGENDTITVNYTTSGLNYGTHNGTITITDPNACNTGKTVSVTVNVAPPSDFNGDMHVDATDFDFFSACYNGPTNLVSGTCLDADMNGDQHVDATDFDFFSACYNGPTNPPGC